MSRRYSPALQKLMAEYRSALPDKLGRIEELRVGAQAPEAARREYQRAVHQLAGSAGSYGLPEVSVAARALDRYLADTLAAERAWEDSHEETLLAALRTTVRETQGEPD